MISRCQKWYWSSQFLNVILGIELLILVFRIQGSHVALGISVVKIIFRAVANHMVKVFIWDLRRSQLPPLPTHHGATYPIRPSGLSRFNHHNHFGGEFPSVLSSRAYPPGFSFGGTTVGEHHPGPHGLNIPKYDFPPTYEEAMREKNFPQDFNNVA